MRGWTLVEPLLLDLRYAARMLWRDRALTTLAVLTLALGIGANTAIFSLMYGLMLRPLPVRAPHELVQLLSQFPGDPRNAGFSRASYEHYRDQNTVFSDLIGGSLTPFRVSRDGLDPETIHGGYVTGNYFPTLGLRPVAGRLLDPHDDQPGAADTAVVVLSWSYWKSRFNLDPTIVGRRLMLDETPATVIGIAPRKFSGAIVGVRQDLWVPLAMSRRPDRVQLGLLGRLKPGVSIAQARAEMRGLDRWRIDQIARNNPNPLVRQVRLDVDPGGAGYSPLRDQFARPLQVLMVVVGLVLLIACVDVAAMLLARSAARQREMAVRVALGAGRLRLVGQVLTEALMMSAAASLLGVGLAYAGASALVRILASGRSIPGLPGRLELNVQPDLQVLLFTAAAAVLTALLFGMAPAWSAFRSAPVSLLRHAGQTPSRRLFGQSLVVAQIVMSVVLLSAAGLFVGHLSHLRHADTGFRSESVLLVSLEPQGAGYNRQQLTALYQNLLTRLQTIPGVRRATLSAMTPTSGAGWSRYVVVDDVQESANERRYVSVNAVAPKYFETFGTPLLAGRDFEVEDAGRPRVAIINRALAQHYFGTANPIGRSIAFSDDPQPYQIVGLVADAKYTDLREAAPRTIYLNAFQDGRIGSQFALLTDVSPAAISGDLRRVVQEVLKTVRVGRMTTLAEQADGTIVPERMLASLSGLFGALGALLAAVGLYGLLAYTVVRRAHEIGIRMALGATRQDVLGMVLKNAFGLLAAGLAIGIPLAIAGRRVVDRVMPLSIDTTMPIVTAIAGMIAIGLLAASVPARRATRVEPRSALKQD